MGRIHPGSIEFTQTLEQVSCSVHRIPVASQDHGGGIGQVGSILVQYQTRLWRVMPCKHAGRSRRA